MNDLISRQDAIDALGDEPEVWTGRDEYAMGLNNQWHYDSNAILSCPSAHPKKKLTFTKRLEIAKEYKEWCYLNNIAYCPESFLTYLCIKGFIYG